VVEAFKIPSGSMLPTLQIGDHIFVSKFAYGPKLPFLDRRILDDLPPKRGDVIVFEYPDPDVNAERQDYIKRVVAVPGDTLEVDAGHPIINGWRVPSCRVGKYQYGNPADFGGRRGDLYVEFLEGTAFLSLYSDLGDHLRQGPYLVRPGEAWVMGDNRHNSSDSRAWRIDGRNGAGVPYANIKGRAMIVWLPFSRMLVNVMGDPVLPEGTSAEVLLGVERCLAERPPPAETIPPPPSGAGSLPGD
jgi:signal peptidase I